MRYWQDHFLSLGLAFVPLPASTSIAGIPECMQTARDAHAWLRQQQFDVIHFPELHGYAYYCVLAKHQGLDFPKTILCVGTHSPISWIRLQNKEPPYSAQELEMDFMERQSVALADVVVSPSQYMLSWMRARGWVLPAKCYVQQNVVPRDLMLAASLRRQDRSGAHKARELVFFGRLEARKGIGLFCDALDLLKNRNFSEFTVTFLGKNGRIAGQDAVKFVRTRAQKWPFPYRLLTDYGRDAALQFLSDQPGRIAVIPSLEDNLPTTVMECLVAGIPFLAARSGGIPELIAASDLDTTTFSPDASELAERLAHALSRGVPVARPAVDVDMNRQRWVEWHFTLASECDNAGSATQVESAGRTEPLVTVCLQHRSDCELLHQSLESVCQQNYPQLELLISDRETCTADPRLQHLILSFERKGGRVASFSGQCCSGDYVLFLEAPDYLTPEAIATFVKVAKHTSSDVLTCFLNLWRGPTSSFDKEFIGQYPFLGSAILSGVFRNHFGARFVFVKREALARVGEFPSSVQRDCADWQFLARAALMQCKIEVVPAALGWHRVLDKSEADAGIDYLGQLEAINPYEAKMPALLRGLPTAALTMGLHYQTLLRRFAQSPAGNLLYRLSVARERRDGDFSGVDEGALLWAINQMPKRARVKLASLLDGWLEYSAARSELSPPGWRRVWQIGRQLARGHYHRYGHGWGTALRDLRGRSRAK
jgi:glycosyltransferase involved in cell wall biosynthesis